MEFVIVFAPLFSNTVFQRAKILLTGAILSPASRTVANVLRVMGLSRERHFQQYHRVLARAGWSCLRGSKSLLELLINAFGIGNEMVIGFDDHLERRRSRKIKAKGIYRDAVRSSDKFFVKASGLRWLCFMLLTEVPFAKRIWVLPFLTVWCPPERYHQRRGIRHRKLTDQVRQAIFLIAGWCPAKELIFVGDSSYAVLDLLNAVREKAVLVTRVRLDAALYEPAADRTKGQVERPRKKGRRLKNLTEIIKRSATKWQKMQVNRYRLEREIEITSEKCVWFHIGKRSGPDPVGNRARPCGKV